MIAAIVRCAASARLVSDAQERPLGRAERWSLAAHLLLCAKCRRYRAQVRRLHGLLADCDSQPTGAAGDAGVCERIRAGLRRRLGEESGPWRR
jgi:predicted anti-sigma-YlaC factor YlaD